MRIRRRDAAFLVTSLVTSLFAAAGASADDAKSGGGLVGWVENTQGAPLSGAVVSLFGRGIRGGSLVTLTDSAGQFALPSLPPGSYTLRAVSNGHQPAPARQITVLPNHESLFTVALTPDDPSSGTTAEEASAAVSTREWRWLVRHRRRSALEATEHTASTTGSRTATAEGPTPSDHPLADLAGSLEFLAAPLVLANGSETPALDPGANIGALRLGGHFDDGGSWSLGGLLAENTNTTWRMAAEFVLQPMEGHTLEAGAGFGTRDLRFGGSDTPASALDARSLGAIFVKDNWTANERVSGTMGVRYSFVGLLADRNYVDPFASLSIQPDRKTRLRAAVGSHTLAPGGDLLTVSTISSAPALVLARLDDAVQAERALRLDLSADRTLDETTSVGAFSYYEDVRDQMLNAYEGDTRARSLRITNVGAFVARGVGVSVNRAFGNSVRSSFSYSYGHCTREGAVVGPAMALGLPGPQGSASNFHDFVARVETLIDATDTRLAAYFRLNSLRPVDADPRATHSSALTTRFDVQLTQGLPFLQSLTRADWEVLVSVRNLSYETAEAGVLDELAVLRPPKRVLGGVSVRF
jgi:hypothetical protein